MEKSSKFSRAGQHPFVRALATLWSVLISLSIVFSFLAIMFFTGGREFSLWLSSVSWQETQCEILKATYDRREKNQAGSGSVDISFKTIVSYRFQTDFGAYRGSCYRKPTQSVISRGFQSDFFWMLIPLLSIGPFAYMALMSILGKFRPPKKVKSFLP
jgi:hypothetical protein